MKKQSYLVITRFGHYVNKIINTTESLDSWIRNNVAPVSVLEYTQGTAHQDLLQDALASGYKFQATVL